MINMNTVLATIKAIWDAYLKKMAWHQEGVAMPDLATRCNAHLASQFARRISNEILMTPHHMQSVEKFARHTKNQNKPAPARELISCTIADTLGI